MTKSQLLKMLEKVPDNAPLIFYTSQSVRTYHDSDPYEDDYKIEHTRVDAKIDYVSFDRNWWRDEYMYHYAVIPLKGGTFTVFYIDKEWREENKYYTHMPVPKHFFKTKEEVEEFKKTYVFKHPVPEKYFD